MENGVQLAACESKSIKIGNDCMFSHSINIRTTDSHTIVNKNGNRTNFSKDIIIGNHIWIGMQSLILKGAKIPDNCVIAAKSIVSRGKYEENCILAGHPAKIIKNEINWKRELL